MSSSWRARSPSAGHILKRGPSGSVLIHEDMVVRVSAAVRKRQLFGHRKKLEAYPSESYTPPQFFAGDSELVTEANEVV